MDQSASSADALEHDLRFVDSNFSGRDKLHDLEHDGRGWYSSRRPHICYIRGTDRYESCVHTCSEQSDRSASDIFSRG